MSEPTKEDLAMEIRILKTERNELTVSLAIARCDASALEAQVEGLKIAVAALRRGNEARPR